MPGSTQPTEGAPKIYTAELELVREIVTQASGVAEPRVWSCPCASGCAAKVVYVRDELGHVWFMANVTFQEKPPYATFRFNEPKDLDDILVDEAALVPLDRDWYRYWFELGLRQALLAELQRTVN